MRHFAAMHDSLRLMHPGMWQHHSCTVLPVFPGCWGRGTLCIGWLIRCPNPPQWQWVYELCCERNNRRFIMADPSASASLCRNCRCRPVAAATGLCGFEDWCSTCDASLFASQFAEAESAASEPAVNATKMCTNCHCRPVATQVKCGFDDVCSNCDLEMFTSQEYAAKCDRARFPRPPPHHIRRNDEVCPCGFFAIRHRPLARTRPGKENLPLHQLVTVPLTATAHIIICLICEQTFKHHRNAVKHMQMHHTHFHSHHGP